jgi:hypothetical protein
MKFCTIFEEVDEDYSTKLNFCTNVQQLKELVEKYKWCARDAWTKVQTMQEKDWTEFKIGLQEERRKRFAGEVWMDKYGDILLPLPMMLITGIKAQFNVSFGLIVSRLLDERMAVEEDEYLVIKEVRNGLR